MSLFDKGEHIGMCSRLWRTVHFGLGASDSCVRDGPNFAVMWGLLATYTFGSVPKGSKDPHEFLAAPDDSAGVYKAVRHEDSDLVVRLDPEDHLPPTAVIISPCAGRTPDNSTAGRVPQNWRR